MATGDEIKDIIKTDGSLRSQLSKDLTSAIVLDENGYQILNIEADIGSNVTLDVSSVTNPLQGDYAISVIGTGVNTFEFSALLQDKVTGVIDYSKRNDILIVWNYAIDETDTSIASRIQSITITHADKLTPYSFVGWTGTGTATVDGSDLKSSGASNTNDVATILSKIGGSGVEMRIASAVNGSALIYLAGTPTPQTFTATSEASTHAIYSGSITGGVNARMNGANVGASLDITDSWVGMRLTADGSGYYNVEWYYRLDSDGIDVVIRTEPLQITAGTDVYIHGNLISAASIITNARKYII